MSELETQTRITVEGTPYAIPALDTLNIREGKTMKRHSGMTLDQVFEAEGLDAGVIGGLLAIAIQRFDASITDRQVDEMVDRVNLFAVLEELAAVSDAMSAPTSAEARPLESESKTSNDEPTTSSGNGGGDDSAPSQEPWSQPSTGNPDSAYDPMTLEA